MPIVQSCEAVTLIGGGDVAGATISRALALAPRLVAADGGADRALAAGYMPEAVIGDLDSISPAACAAVKSAANSAANSAGLHRIEEQETTDFEKCLTRIDAPFILAIGFTGPRLDHTLAVWNALARTRAAPCLVLGDEDVVFAAPPGRWLALELAGDTRVSLFPMAKLRGEATGLRWPIGGLDFAPDGRVGTSNVALGPVSLRFEMPGMLVIVPRDCLGAAIAALVPAAR